MVAGAEIQKAKPSSAAIEQALIGGDLSGLNDAERLSYYKATCESLGLNPLTKPFAYIKLNNKLVLYALKDCTEQLRKNHGVSLELSEAQVVDDVYVIRAHATDKTGRKDSATGCVPIKGLFGDAKANAMMKAETKAKRRVTLSICGLGMLDETEVETIPSAATEEEDRRRKADAEAAEEKRILIGELKVALNGWPDDEIEALHHRVLGRGKPEKTSGYSVEDLRKLRDAAQPKEPPPAKAEPVLQPERVDTATGEILPISTNPTASAEVIRTPMMTEDQEALIQKERDRLGAFAFDRAVEKTLRAGAKIAELTYEEANTLWAALCDMKTPEPGAEVKDDPWKDLPSFDENGKEIKWISCPKGCGAPVYWAKGSRGQNLTKDTEGKAHLLSCPKTASKAQ